MSYSIDNLSTPPRRQDYDASRIDPWDGAPVDRRGTRSVVLESRPWRLILLWSILAAALVLALTSALRAQMAPPRPPESDKQPPDRIRVVLKGDARELARDYLEILEQIKALTEDYSRYYADLETEPATQLEDNLRKLYRQLSDSAYFSDLKQLEYDLAKLHYELELREKEQSELIDQRRAEGKSNRTATSLEELKLKKVTTSLRRELDIVKSRLDHDLLSRLSANQARSALVKQYIKKAVAAAEGDESFGDHHIVVGVGEGDSREMVVVEIDLQMLENITEVVDLDELRTLADVTPASAPAVISLPDVTILPAPDLQPTDLPPPEVSEKKITRHPISGRMGLTLEMVDSTRTRSAITPVYIVNPFGSLDVEGWDRDWIMVGAKMEISSEKTERAEALADRIGIRIHNKLNSVYIEMMMPQLSDPKTTIHSAAVEIKAPIDNPLILRNSHGRVYVAGFDNGVKVKGDHCDIDLRGILGSVEVSNNMGRLAVNDVSGRLELSNAYEALEVSRCEGDMTIENAYASIDLTGCTGDVRVRNSGSVDVVDHTGEVEIHNNNGVVVVENLDGNLQVANSLHPVVVKNIRGSAGLENVRGAIQITKVYGPLAASNMHGNITAAELTGPLHLVSSDGVIDLDVGRAITGNSSITADYGTINLWLAEQSDLLLTVETLGGDIQSSFSTPVNQTDSSRTTRIELGRLTGSLDVSARDADIVINQGR